MEIQPKDIIILRCCRDWPVHAYAIYDYGTCRLCGNRPEAVFEKYPESEYARNKYSA